VGGPFNTLPGMGCPGHREPPGHLGIRAGHIGLFGGDGGPILPGMRIPSRCRRENSPGRRILPGSGR